MSSCSVEVKATAIERYDAYKDSGVEWLGEIPEHWDVARLGSILSPVSQKNCPDLPLLSITREKGVIVRDIEDEDENHNYIPDDLSNYKLLKAGQFGMNKMKAWQGSYGIAPATGIVSPAYYVFNVADSISPDYFHLAIRSKVYVSFFGSSSDGVRIGQWDLSKSRMTNIPFLIPSISEQKRMATFIREKFDQIDRAIAIKQKQIELLKERRQILIHNAVTRGLDPNVEMKDSGVEWIGEVPKHWEVKRLKFLGNLFSGLSDKKGDDFSKEPIKQSKPYIPFTNICKNLLVKKGEYHYVKMSDSESQNMVLKDDILFLMSSETLDDIGKCSLYSFTDEVYLNSFCKGFRLTDKSISSLFLIYLLSSLAYRIYFGMVGRGFTRINIKQEYINEIQTLIPPIQEQIAIASFITKADEKIHLAVLLIEQEIEKLKEYKASLVNSVVTGKVKVT